MKKYTLLAFFLLPAAFANANTSFTISGGPNIFSQCEVPTGGGDCIQTYETDQGYVTITVNGVQFANGFDAEPTSTAGLLGQEFAAQISSYFGVSVTVTPLDGADQDHVANSQMVSVEIADNYTLSDAHTVETNPNVCSSCSFWYIFY